MTAALNASTITFSGVDANPSALAGIAGVTSIVMGGVTVYNCGALAINFSGDTTVDPRFYQILTTGTVTVTAILRAGIEYTSAYGGGTLYSKGIALQTSGSLNTTAGSTLVVRGATLKYNGTTGPWWVWSGATDAVNMVLDGKHGINQRLRLQNPVYKNWNPTVVGFQVDNLYTPTAATDLRNPYSENVGVGQELALAMGVGSAVPFVVTGVPKTAGNVLSPFSNFSGMNNPIIFNSEDGSNVMIMPDGTGNTGTSGHGGLVFARYQIAVKDGVNTPINAGCVYLRDTNNGLRKIKYIVGGSVIDKTADQLHINTLTAGQTPVTDLLIAHIYRNNAVGDIAQPDGNELYDLRCKSNTKGVDNFDLHYWAYAYTYQRVTDLAMKGLAVVKGTVVTALDTTVTKTEAQVAALTEINTLDDLVDYCKYYKTRPLQANLEYPTVGTHFVQVAGDSVDLLAQSLVINAGAASVFSISGAVITIKSTGLNAGTKYKTLKTTGAVSGNLTVNYTDASNAGYITAQGSDGNTVELRRASDNSIIRSRVGDGGLSVAPADVGVSVYLARTSSGIVVASSRNAPKTLAAGDNGTVMLYAGAQVQVAGLGDVVNKVDSIAPALQIINVGVQKASILVPHMTNI